MIGGIEAEIFSVPDPIPRARYPWGYVCSRIERLLDRPVVWQINFASRRSRQIRCGSSPGTPCLGVGIGLLVPGSHRKGNVTFVEQPLAVEQESLAHGRASDDASRLQGMILREQNDGTRNKEECAT